MSQQLIKKGANGNYTNVMPKSWIDAIRDKSTGQTLVEILQGFNMYFLPYNGSTSTTRCLVPTMLRKKGLWITYVKYDGNVYTEWYAADEIDDKSWGDSSNWRIGNNTLVGDITISANGNWVINGTETEFKAIGEKGNTPLLRVYDNKLQVSYNLGESYINVTNNPVYTKFRWASSTVDAQNNIVGRIQATTDEGKTWTNMSNDFTNNLHISKYIGANESLPTSGIAEGTIYAKGPTYDAADTAHENPKYRLWVYAWKGNTLAWQDNGEFTSITAGIVQETGDSETEVMSQKIVTEKLTELGNEKNIIKLVGNGSVGVKAEINYLKPGNLYRIFLRNTNFGSNVDIEEGSAIFEIYYKNTLGEIKVIHRVEKNGILKPYYDFVTTNENYPIAIYIVASKGESLFFEIRDLSYLEESKNGSTNVVSGLSGTYINSGYKRGFIPFTTAEDFNFDLVQDSDNFIHTVIQVKEGDTYLIKGKGGLLSLLFIVLDDNKKKVLTYSNQNVDYSEHGYIFRVYNNGYLIINQNIHYERCLLLCSKITELDYTKFLNFTEGSVDYRTGIYMASSTNLHTNYASLFEAKRIKLTVNVSTIENSGAGLAFYNSKREYISGIQCLYSNDKGISEQIYNIPDGACYIRSSIYAEYKESMQLCLLGDSTNKTYFNKELTWGEGYYNYYDGRGEASAVNLRTTLDISSYNKIRMTVNKSITGSSAGIVFFDDSDNFICGYAYPDSGGLSDGRSFVEQVYNIPANAKRAGISFYKEFLNDFFIELIKENREHYLAEQFNNLKEKVVIGYPSIYISENTAEEYTSLNEKTVEQLYEEYDNLLSLYPDMVTKQVLGSVVHEDSGKTYELREYTIGNKFNMVIHYEPSKDEVLTESVNSYSEYYQPTKILINGGMHGEEKTACWGLMLSIKELLSSEENWAKYIKSNCILKVLVCLNPYGFDNNYRRNTTNVDLNRDGSQNAPERLIYMNWISQNKDAECLIDVHGTQGRYAYTPIWRSEPLYKFVSKFTLQLSTFLQKDYESFYKSLKQGYEVTYKPYLVAKYSAELGEGRCAVEMYRRFGMKMFALETPSNIIYNPSGIENENNSGLINMSDLRNCKITKDLLINAIQFVCHSSIGQLV